MYVGIVDYENTNGLNIPNVKDYDLLYIFVGAYQSKLNIKDLPSGYMGAYKIIRVESVGDNNLDFHIAYYLNDIVETATTIDIISNDKGYTGIVEHVCTLGHDVRLVSYLRPLDEPDTTRVINLLLNPNIAVAQSVKSAIRDLDGATDSEVKALCKHINHLLKHPSEQQVDEVLDTLTERGNL